MMHKSLLLHAYIVFVIVHLWASQFTHSQPKGQFCLLMKQSLSQSVELSIIFCILGITLFIFLFVSHVAKRTRYNGT